MKDINIKKSKAFDEVTPYIRIYFSKNEKFFGYGIANLLECVDKYKNFRIACKVMEM